MTHNILNTSLGLCVFGENGFGQLGLGHTRNVNVPTKLDFFENLQILDVCCGAYHTIINTTKGLYVFGCNYEGQLGLGDKKRRIIPTKCNFFNDMEIISIFCGYSYTLINTTDGLYSFGNNGCGQLGLGHNLTVCVPEKLHFFENNDLQIISIHCGDSHTIINTSGGLYSFGSNCYGQLCSGDFIYQNIPTKCDFFEDNNLKIFFVSCGNDFTIINTNNGLYFYGVDENFSSYPRPEANSVQNSNISKLINFFKTEDLHMLNISCGDYHIIVNTTNGLYLLGANNFGQLGLGDTEYRNIPTKCDFFNDKKIISIFCGDNHTLINTTNGLYSFGYNRYGQLGLGDFKKRLAPTKCAFKFDIILKKGKSMVKSAKSIY